MKKFFLASLSLFFALSLFSQSKTDFLTFLAGFDWENASHQYSFTDGKTMVNDLQIGGFPCHATLSKQATQPRVERVLMEFDDRSIFNDISASLFSQKMDNLLIEQYGKPDDVEDDLDELLSTKKRTWYGDKCRIDIIHMFKGEETRMYLLVARWNDKSEPNFRNSRWGDSYTDVKKVEGKGEKGFVNGKYIVSDNVAGMPCDVFFSFTDNQLTQGAYIFTQKHTNRNDYIRDYNNLVSLLSKKYGEPSENKPTWLNSLYKGDIEEYGFAISMGHLVYAAKWYTPLTEIVVSLSGENSEIDLFLIYSSTQLEATRKAAEEKTELRGL